MHYAVVVAWNNRSAHADNYTLSSTYERDDEEEVYRDCEWDIVQHEIIFDYRVVGSLSRWRCPLKLKKRVDRFFDEEARVNETWEYKWDSKIDPDESRCYQCTKKCIDIKQSLIPDIYIDEHWIYHEFIWWDSAHDKKEWDEKYIDWLKSLLDDMLITVIDAHL